MKTGNHVRKIQRMLASGEIRLIPGVTLIDVKHDDGCRFFKGKPCNCDPDIVVKWNLEAMARN